VADGERAGTSGRRADGKSVLRPSRWRRRRDRDEPADGTGLLDDSGLFDVDGGVPEVIEPALPAGPEPAWPAPYIRGARRGGASRER
jgi:hypothetical protein